MSFDSQRLFFFVLKLKPVEQLLEKQNFSV